MKMKNIALFTLLATSTLLAQSGEALFTNYCLDTKTRITVETTTIRKEGSQIHKSSLFITKPVILSEFALKIGILEN